MKLIVNNYSKKEIAFLLKNLIDHCNFIQFSAVEVDIYNNKKFVKKIITNISFIPSHIETKLREK